MKKSTKQSYREAKTPSYSPKFVDRDLTKVSPMKEQFEPTDACPVRQRARMAGQN